MEKLFIAAHMNAMNHNFMTTATTMNHTNDT